MVPDGLAMELHRTVRLRLVRATAELSTLRHFDGRVIIDHETQLSITPAKMADWLKLAKACNSRHRAEPRTEGRPTFDVPIAEKE